MTSEVFIDWDVAARTAKKLRAAGPDVTLDEAKEAVAELRVLAERAHAYVSDVTQIPHPEHSAPTHVIDRDRWIDENAISVGHLLRPLVDQLTEKSNPSRLASAIGRRVTGAEAGVLLAFMSSRVLGQYDVFGPSGGQLLLVAPNIIEAERKLDVAPADFRLWVCIHEVTHRLQFTAVPWLADYMRGLVAEFVEVSNLDPEAVRERLKEVAATLRERRSKPADTDESTGRGLLSLAGSPEQRAVIDKMTAAMSLLEGHAEYVMDEVGPSVIPSVAAIRRKFAKRRKGRGPVDRFFRRLLGLEAKMRQYADGRAFVDAIVDQVGMKGFNHVWTSPDTLPTMSELKDAGAWLGRVAPPGQVEQSADVTEGNGAMTRTFTIPRSDAVPLAELDEESEREIIIERRTGDN